MSTNNLQNSIPTTTLLNSGFDVKGLLEFALTKQELLSTESLLDNAIPDFLLVKKRRDI